MKAKHLAWLFAGVAIAAFIAGILSPLAPRGPATYVGTSQTETNWPFRYIIYGKAGARKGYVEHRTAIGWSWERAEDMDIFEQSKDSLSFRTHLAETGQQSPQAWHLLLQKGPQGLSGILVSDSWDSKAVSLSFRRMGSM